MKSKRRRGAVFLLLVFLLLLVIVAATQSMVQREIAGRKAERDRLRGRSLNAAIATLYDADESIETIQLPVDGDLQNDGFIEVQADRQANQFTATWHRNDVVIDRMTKTFPN